jgi:hypothetical protein
MHELEPAGQQAAAVDRGSLRTGIKATYLYDNRVLRASVSAAVPALHPNAVAEIGAQRPVDQSAASQCAHECHQFLIDI